ncbi:Spx/MgsR family RNA polymerase-binding regulatory protein [Thiosulfativibrio zosterae]|uniref:Arsenate reductase n=1 Tax=Thiosulfativibrio zosterae TaxID=2675053 RepID=A0A6F8PN42_9GAMM|nr:Spx/MgsR family RNA polymerase-binding regulatory protein [Thiosulfativibrio zosterae]BBP43515.1 arsenate reductase [Thiosulfativibrio zosterae]
MILYGIPNCDTVRKARKWLETHQIAHEFIDFRKGDFTQKDIQAWLKLVPFETVLNPKSTAWKTLTAEQTQAVKSQQDLGLLVEYPTLIKRPVLFSDNLVIFGFNEAQYQTLLA